MAPEVTGPPAHSKRVQAWLYAILNPVIECLQREVFLLAKGNLSWRSYSKRCEYIRPILEYIEGPQRPNYDDFLSDPLNPRFPAMFEDHDRAVNEVESKAAQFAENLAQTQQFQNDIRKSLAEYSSAARANPGYPDLESMGDTLAKAVTEFLVNRIEVVPAHYLTHRFWEVSRASFEGHFQRESFRDLERATSALKNISDQLLRHLRDHRQYLCRTYDIPAAPIPLDKSHNADALLV